ncbi:MAG: ABC transporter substrate-binding protein [Sulfurospirillum sp.]|nr:ABC transporter substrate-binding protein [Sulfurospirillum sp.]
MVKKNFLLWLGGITVLSIILVVTLRQFRASENETILLGASLPLSGINSHLGKDVVVGANTYFSHTNAKGGVHGKKIEFIQYDDKYEPENTLSHTQTLIEKDKVFALFGFVGTPTVKRVLPLISHTNIPFIAPYTGASFLRDNSSDNIINFRSSYIEEIDALVDYLTQEKGLSKFAIFYQNDDYGEEGYIALSQALDKHHLKLSAEGTYKRNTLSISHAIHEIESAKPEAIILVGAYKPTARFIEKVKECCPQNIIFCPISFVNADALVDELKGDARNILFSQTVPSYDDFTSSEAIEYTNLLKFYYPNEKPSLVSYESYLAAKTVVKAMREINGLLTQAKFTQALKNTNRYTLDNIPLGYHHSQLLNRVYLSTYENKKFNIISKHEY